MTACQVVRFDATWWSRVLAAWNTSRHRHTLAGAGAFEFHVVGTGESGVRVSWNDKGFGRVIHGGAGDLPRFSGTKEAWGDLLRGRLTAMRGIVDEHLDYRGPLERIFPYAESFDLLAEVARKEETRPPRRSAGKPVARRKRARRRTTPE